MLIMTKDGHVGPAKITVEPATSPRLGIAINLKELEVLMKEYSADVPQDLSQSLTLSLFLQWLINKQKENEADGTQET